MDYRISIAQNHEFQNFFIFSLKNMKIADNELLKIDKGDYFKTQIFLIEIILNMISVSYFWGTRRYSSLFIYILLLLYIYLFFTILEFKCIKLRWMHLQMETWKCKIFVHISLNNPWTSELNKHRKNGFEIEFENLWTVYCNKVHCFIMKMNNLWLKLDEI